MRHCDRCGTPIDVCMGFVKAGDFLEMIQGTRKPEEIRELCEKCALKPLFFETKGELASFLQEIGWAA